MGIDWREGLLREAVPVDVPGLSRNPSRWPGYDGGRAVSVHRLRRPSGDVVVAAWDFGRYGGSFGEDDATALAAGCRLAAAEGVPLLTLVRSGGTRLQEGMNALVGIPRARLALTALAAAGLAHLSVADAPTTGGVWISVTSTADVRVAVEGATVGFAGPRVVEAVTGSALPAGSHTAASAGAAGLVDEVLRGEDVSAWLDRVLTALRPGPAAAEAAPDVPVPSRDGWGQVLAARAREVGGAAHLAALSDRVPLAAPRGDTSVAACLGRLAGRPVVGVALAARPGGRPTPDGFRLLARAAALADRVGVPLVSLVDTPGAEPGDEAERDGVAAAIATALDAVLACRSPVLAWVHGEGGSGGALAAAAGDLLLLGPDGYFAAIAPEGAAAALRRPPRECAELLRLTPADLLASGAADAVTTWAGLPARLDALAAVATADRLAARHARWASPLPRGASGPAGT